jgi:AraC-like DNA-binding protein
MPEQTVDAVSSLPAPPLRPFVERYFAYRLEGFAPGIHRGLPSRFLTFIVSLRDPIELAGMPGATGSTGSFAGVLSGLHAGPAMIRHDGNQAGVGVEVTPLGARALLGLPAGALASTTVEPHEVLGRRAASLPERLAASASWHDRFRILDHLLTQSLNERSGPPPEVAFAWRSLVATGGSAPVQAIAREVGWSRRHLAERFRSEVGVAPKVAARMLRFERARALLGGPERPSLAEVAAECGYFDQAHMTRDFNQFAGCSPTAWMAGEELPSVQDRLGESGADSSPWKRQRSTPSGQSSSTRTAPQQFGSSSMPSASRRASL